MIGWRWCMCAGPAAAGDRSWRVDAGDAAGVRSAGQPRQFGSCGRCALSSTSPADPQGVYDPTDHRLLLGLKSATMRPWLRRATLSPNEICQRPAHRVPARLGGRPGHHTDGSEVGKA